MISSFDLNKLQPLFQDFYTLTGIHISLFNEKYEEIFPYPKDLPSFCQVIRGDKTAASKCRNCDYESCKKAAKRHNIYFYECHAGLMEACTPIYVGEVIVGYIIAGNIFTYPDHDTGWNRIKELCSDYSIDQAQLKEACYERPLMTKDYVFAACHILETIASYLCNERVAILKKGNLHAQIDEYIRQHLSEDLNAEFLCHHFSIGKTYLYEITNSTYGTGVAEHIKKLRMEKAKELLENNTQISISEIAASCGFRNYNYFIAAFRKEYGVSPKQYQRRHFKI